jgi:Baseplate J-like protein
MIDGSPKIDSRSAAEVADKVRDLLNGFATGWNKNANDPLASALIAIFARYAEIVIQRLNQVPRKNFMAFLDLLGASLLPPQPARAPLTFSLAASSAADGVVPAGTQVAAPPGEGEAEPVIYETERELIVTAAQLNAMFVLVPERDAYADRSSLVSAPVAGGEPLFEGQRPIDHIFYLGDREFFSTHRLRDVKLMMTFDHVVEDEMEIQWDHWDGAGWRKIITLGINPNTAEQAFDLGELGPIPLSGIAKMENRWVRGWLLTPITLSTDRQAGKVRAGQLPTITELKLEGKIVGAGAPAEHSFANQFPLDTSREFSPFGERPKLGDAWLLAHPEAFSHAGVKVALDISIANKVTNGSPELKWEFWDGKVWQPLNGVTGEPQRGEMQDTTANLTKSGTVILQLPGPSVPREINGVVGSWLRVRLAQGDYGEEASYRLKTPGKPEDGYLLTPATFASPIIGPLQIDYDGTKESEQIATFAYNNFVLSFPDSDKTLPPSDRAAKLPFNPFRTVSGTSMGGEARPTFYLGFRVPQGSNFPQRTISLYFGLIEPLFGEVITRETGRPELTWEYWDGAHWKRLLVNDDSAALTRSGLVEFLPPADFARRRKFGRARYWLRVRWEKGSYRVAPRARQLLLNTTMGVQAATVRGEILGSSDGSKSQAFRATRAPILDGPQLEVREPELPSAAEQREIRALEGEDAITIIPDAAGRPQEIWVRWHEVPDFYDSQPRHRHYVLDHLTGEIRFGDGLSGLIPPIGAGNLRLARYRTGGGRAGNRPAGAIVQLKTTVPYVDSVTNREAAAGGADAESLDSLIERAPRAIRHNNRAVTVEDFEDMAMLASPEVARAKCVPLLNLSENPLLLEGTTPGEVSVIIVPRSTAPKPLPSLELIRRVQEHLDAHATPTARVRVTGPLYLRVEVEVDVAIASFEGAGAVEQAIRQRLAAFLHPLTGGLDGKGWEFGRAPHLSDLYALIEAVPGVDHIIRLQEPVEGLDDADAAWLNASLGKSVTTVKEVKGTGRFLVYSGAHTINLKFE